MQLNVFLEEPNCQIKQELQLALHSNKNKPQTSMAGVKSKLRLGTLKIQEAKKIQIKILTQHLQFKPDCEHKNHVEKGCVRYVLEHTACARYSSSQ